MGLCIYRILSSLSSTLLGILHHLLLSSLWPEAFGGYLSIIFYPINDLSLRINFPLFAIVYPSSSVFSMAWGLLRFSYPPSSDVSMTWGYLGFVYFSFYFLLRPESSRDCVFIFFCLLYDLRFCGVILSIFFFLINNLRLRINFCLLLIFNPSSSVFTMTWWFLRFLGFLY